jgi:hypothetical protein
VQELLSPSGGFAVGDHFTIADAAIAPFLGRWELLFRNDVGKYADGEGKRVHEVLFRSERFARLQKYFANISSRPSFKNSFDSVRASRDKWRISLRMMLIELFSGIFAEHRKGEDEPTESVKVFTTKESSCIFDDDKTFWCTTTVVCLTVGSQQR